MTRLSIQATVILQILWQALAQFPMPFPFPQASHPMMPQVPPIAPIPPPPMVAPPSVPIHYPLQQKLPVIVMPYYSKAADKPAVSVRAKSKVRRKRRRLRPRYDYSSTSTETDYSDSSSADYDIRRSNGKRRRQVLTPMVSYVTKDGYVVYQKKVKKDKAMDWLSMGKKGKDDEEINDEELLKKLKRMKKHRKRKH